METPICVADAKTLVDNIHDIKRWIYNGQLRLVLPSCTTDVVEQIYQTSKEVKSVPKETARPKSFGKPAKIEYPPFDLNPLLAKNFLARLKTWKEEDAASEQRIFFQEKENHGAVSFQQPSEQYTPWKDSEVEEEKPQVVEDRPTTWAEALRRKQNLANGITGNQQAPKGPAKPKLVAKAAGTETSPWKIKKDAPKILAKDVPTHLRPLMSCTLWRLHESIDRNDSNELFVLSDNSEVRNVSQKLNISARTTRELGALVAAKAKRPELGTFGDLEREFGRHTPTERTRSRYQQNNGELQTYKIDKDGLAKYDEEMKDSISSDQTAKTEDSHVMEDGRSNDLEQQVEALSCATPKAEDVPKPKDTESISTFMESHALEKPASYDDIPNTPENQGLNTRAVNDTERSLSLENTAQTIAEVPPNTLGLAPSEKATTPAISLPDQMALGTAVPPASSAALQTPPPSTQKDSAEPESEDSDEDIVVFVPQPKRSSMQKKPNQQNSRPSTPLTQQQTLVDQNTRPSPTTAQQLAKPSGRGRSPKLVSHGHPQPTKAPTVIDPDAFGRSFAVNPNPNPRPIRNPRSHHRPRPSAENALLPQGSRGSRQNSPRMSPPARTRSPRISLADNSKDETLRPQSSHAHRTSPQKQSRTLDIRTNEPSRKHGSDHAIPEAQIQVQQKPLSTRMMESEEFVPRSVFAEAKLDPIGTPKTTGLQDSLPKTVSPAIQVKPKVPESTAMPPDEIIPRISADGSLSRPQTPKSLVIEPNDFVPRNAAASSQYRQRLAPVDPVEPKSSMPDVQYVLKSGSTRAATRGRGRLWIPS